MQLNADSSCRSGGLRNDEDGTRSLPNTDTLAGVSVNMRQTAENEVEANQQGAKVER